MADISEWSPVDESNNQAPPHGFPEFQSTASINNCARAMMGAVRRWYDSLTAELASLTTSLAGYLPLTGGVITGPVTITDPAGLSLSGVLLRNVEGGLDVSAGGTGTTGWVYAHGPETGIYWGDNNQTSPDWGWYANGGAAYLWQGAVGNVLTVTPDGNLTVPHAVNTQYYLIEGAAFAGRNASSGSHDIYDGAGGLALALYGTDNYYRADAHHWQNEAGAQTASLDAAGLAVPTINATTIGASTVNAATLGAGNATVSGTLNAAAVAAAGAVSAGSATVTGAVSAGSVNATSQYNLNALPFAAMDPGATSTVLYDPGAANITMYGPGGGTNYYDQNQHQFRSRGGGTVYCYFNAGGTYNVSGGWQQISDADHKSHVAPYTRGLDAVLALSPVQYRYSSGPFAGPDTRYGLIAQDMQTVVPEMVGEVTLGDEIFLTMQPVQLLWLLVNSVKELTARIEALEGEP